MGRKLKYKTKEEKRKANNIDAMKYYWKNVDTIRKRNLKKYYEQKNNN